MLNLDLRVYPKVVVLRWIPFSSFLVTIPNLFFRFWGKNFIFHRGFFCEDPELRYPKKPETYTGKVVWAVVTIVPLTTV